MHDKQSDTNDVQVHGNNQLQCDTQLSDNSIPETASSRQSDVIKSRGYLIHVPCVRTQIAYIGRICIHLAWQGVHEIDTRKSEFIDGRQQGWNRWFESRRIPNHRCARGKRAGIFENREIDSAWRVKCQSIWLFRRGVKPWRKMAGGWVTSSPAFSLHVFAKEKPTIYFEFCQRGNKITLFPLFLPFTHLRQDCSKQIRYGII